MTIDTINFTPFSALWGGVLIGGAALILMFGIGRIMGISGIADAATKFTDRSGLLNWQSVFLAGLIVSPIVYTQVWGLSLDITITDSVPLLAIAGLLVGAGTRLGSGCTSGHGICGLSRFSLRSFAAVCTFMATAFITQIIV